MKIKLEIDCVNCGETIEQWIESIEDDKGHVSIHVMCFEQSDWDCEKCGHQTVTADMEMMDAEEI